MRKLLKYPIFYALLIICAGVALRVVLNIQGWTPTNSDESIMNLMALHIAYRGEHPTFFYGQDYLGAFEAYVGAVLFRIFGPSVLAMRLEMIGFDVEIYCVDSWLKNRASRVRTRGRTRKSRHLDHVQAIVVFKLFRRRVPHGA